jgi:benzoyl-CoA reductase/2-hydroxyglutaryl-CoA dehydratase subunit BcrC/BadD/HgdB
MEALLREFSGMTDEALRREQALKIRKQGGKIIGYLDPYVPEEIIYAADMFPWYIKGTKDAVTPRASVYRPRYTSLYCRHVLESLLKGELDFLDGIIMTDWDDDHVRLWDQIRFAAKIPFSTILHVPQIKSQRAIAFFARTLQKFKNEIQSHFQVELSDDKLQEAIRICNKTRDLLSKLYDFRMKRPFSFSGVETLKIVNAAMTMPKDYFNNLMSEFLATIEEKENTLEDSGFRLLLTSDWLNDLSYVDLIESLGAVVAMDDLNTGSRYFWKKVQEGSDPIYSLAERYLTKPACPRMAFWSEQIDQIEKWVSQYQIDGVINFPELYCWPRRIYSSCINDRFSDNGIPVTTITREYHFSNVGQIQTRIGAFLETLDR